MGEEAAAPDVDSDEESDDYDDDEIVPGEDEQYWITRGRFRNWIYYDKDVLREFGRYRREVRKLVLAHEATKAAASAAGSIGNGTA